MAERSPEPACRSNEWVEDFLQHLAAERGASVYTLRNYRHALNQFCAWHEPERQSPPDWQRLQRDDFRDYLRWLGRHNISRAGIQLRFSAFRSFYKFLVRRGQAETSPIRNLQLPKLPKRLPRFVTLQQMSNLLEAPLKELDALRKNSDAPVSASEYYRDAAILE